MTRLRLRLLALGVAALAGAQPACHRSPAPGKPAAPPIALPPVFAATEGLEWMRLASADWFSAPGSAAPLIEQFRARRLVAEPLGGEWYLLVRTDVEGRCDLGGQARFTKAEAQATPDGQAMIQLTVPPGSRKALEGFTGRNQERAVAFTVDGVVYAAPVLMSKLSSALQLTLPADQLDRARGLAERLGRGSSTLSVRAVVLADELAEEPALREKFRRIATGAAVRK